MSSRKTKKYEWQMAEMPGGISTSNGNWYHISREQIEKYIPGLLKNHSLEKIIKAADQWVNSANALSMVLYLIGVLLGFHPIIIMVMSLVFYLFWYYNTSAFVTLFATPILKMLNSDGFLYVLSAGVFIYLAFDGQYLALWLGISLFFLFKVGLLSLVMTLLRSKSKTDALGMQDRILNMLLIRYGMKEGMLPSKIQQMQDDLINTAHYHKTRKKNKNSE